MSEEMLYAACSAGPSTFWIASVETGPSHRMWEARSIRRGQHDDGQASTHWRLYRSLLVGSRLRRKVHRGEAGMEAGNKLCSEKVKALRLSLQEVTATDFGVLTII